MSRSDEASGEATAAPPTPTTRPADRRRRILVEVLGAAASALLSLSGAVLVLRLWHASLQRPLSINGDSNLAMMTVRNMQRTGWFQTSDLLNAPLGQDLHGYPSALGDLWNAAGLRVLSLVLSPAGTITVAYVLSFATIAITAYACLRLLRVPLLLAVVLGAVYAWLPYHFVRGTGHLYLSNYAAVPLACMLVLAVLRPDLRRWLLASKVRVALALLVAVAIGGSGLYYAVFTLVLLASVAIVALAQRQGWRPVLLAGGLAAAIGAVVAASAIPTVLFRLGGGSIAVEGRSYLATEYYGLKLTHLLLPLSSHRIDAFGALRDATTDSLIPGEGSETLGLIGVVGCVIAVVAAFAVHRSGAVAHRLRALGTVALLAVLWSTVAGFNGVLAAAGIAQLRAWNRMSVVIGFVAIAAAGVAGGWLWRRMGARLAPRRTLRALVAVGAAGSVAVVGLLDQSSDAFVPDYAEVEAQWTSDATFFAAVQDRFGAGAQVFQLPVVAFPESPPVAGMSDYEHLRGYLHSDLAWSYAGVKGSDTEWQMITMADGLTEALPSLVAVGFDAVYVNRTGYDDGAAGVEAELATATGEEPMVDSTGTLAVYDLRGYAAELAESGVPLPSRADVLTPARLLPGVGFFDAEQAEGETLRWLGAHAEATLVNPADVPRKVVLEGRLSAMTANAVITVTIGDEVYTEELRDGVGELGLVLEVQPGVTQVTIDSDTAPTPSTPNDPRDLRLLVQGLELRPLE